MVFVTWLLRTSRAGGKMDGQRALALFSEAVRATFMRWKTLNLAGNYQWVDGGEHEMREELAQQTISGFATAKRAPDPTELEAFLDNYLQDQLNLRADDDSPYEVSILICRLYELIVARSAAAPSNPCGIPARMRGTTWQSRRGGGRRWWI